MSLVIFPPLPKNPESESPFAAAPPPVEAGQTRYWHISSSDISDAEKAQWNAIGPVIGMNFQTSPANPTVSPDHYTGAYWNTAVPVFNQSGILETYYPGGFQPGDADRIVQLLFSWQIGGTSPDYNPNAIFTSYSVNSNNLSNARNRHFRLDIPYTIGFDFMPIGLDSPIAPSRARIFKCKPIYDSPETATTVPVDVTPGCFLQIPSGDTQHRLHFQTAGDDRVVILDNTIQTYDSVFSTTVIRDYHVYRVRIKMVWNAFGAGEVHCYLSEDYGAEETVFSGTNRKTCINSAVTTAGETVAARNAYFGTYIVGQGHNQGSLQYMMDNLYIDRQTAA